MNAAGARSAAQSLLHGIARDSVTVRMPAQPMGGDGEELGMASPQFQDVVLQPALVRTQLSRTTVLVEAAAAEAALSTASVEATLLAASWLETGGRAWQIESVERRSIFGRAYLYRLLLRPIERKGDA